MKTRFVCLANSFKEGGRCIAGIELDENNNPVILNSRPKWVRPVCNEGHGQIPTAVAQPFCILDIIEMEVTGARPAGYQSENVLFNEKSLVVAGSFDIAKLHALCEHRGFIFGNRGKAVSLEAIVKLTHSLMLIQVTEFELKEVLYDDSPKPKLRLEFYYKNNTYDLPITDPPFLAKYQKNKTLLTNTNSLYLTLSLGISVDGWHYKLVAAIMH